MPAEAPHWRLDLVVLLQIVRPKDGPLCGVEAIEIAHRAEGVDFALVDRRRTARTAGVRNLVRASILMFPDLLAVSGVQAEHALGAVEARPREAAGDLVFR